MKQKLVGLQRQLDKYMIKVEIVALVSATVDETSNQLE